MQEIYFLTRHTPFWAIPLIILGSEFAYLFWLKNKRASVSLCVMIALIGVMATSFYVWAGGPEKSVKIIKKFHRSFQ